MDQGPLVTEQIDAGAKFLREFQKYVPVQSAFWLKDNNYGRWNLYVVSDQINDDNFDVAYGEVGRIGAALKDPWFDIFQVKVLGTDEPLAKGLREQRRRYPGRNMLRLDGQMLGGVEVDEVRFYPSPVVAAGMP